MSVSFWEGRNIDDPFSVNGFRGTWKFSDHSLIPGELNNFIMESFHPVERMKRIPLEDINKLMNEVWEGPGSMVKLERLYNEMKSNRLQKMTSNTKDLGEVKTLDDYSEDEITNKVFDDVPPAAEDDE